MVTKRRIPRSPHSQAVSFSCWYTALICGTCDQDVRAHSRPSSSLLPQEVRNCVSGRCRLKGSEAHLRVMVNGIFALVATHSAHLHRAEASQPARSVFQP